MPAAPPPPSILGEASRHPLGEELGGLDAHRLDGRSMRSMRSMRAGSMAAGSNATARPSSDAGRSMRAKCREQS
jgi:hypothetical protein